MNKLLTGLAALLFSVNLYAGELIVNGGFEDPIIAANSWSTFYGQGYTGTCTVDCNGLIPGWNVWWTDTLEPGRIEIQNGNVGGTLPLSGDQKAELDSHYSETGNNNVVIFQFPRVCRGAEYTLNYAWKSRTQTPGDSNMNVLIDYAVVTTFEQNVDEWMEDEYTFVASDSLIYVGFLSIGIDNTLGVFMDDISLTGPLPEECDACEFGKPSSLTMQYTGTNGSDNDQTEYRVIPEVVASFPDPALIKVYNDNGNKRRLLLGSGEMNIGDAFTFPSLKNGKVPPKTSFEIIDPSNGEIVQTVYFHTSCSQPLMIDDKFGGMTVWDAEWVFTK